MQLDAMRTESHSAGHIIGQWGDASVDAELRQKALLSLGEAQGALLNPEKDYEAALETLRRFLQLYPESSLVDSAKRAMERIQSIQAQQ